MDSPADAGAAAHDDIAATLGWAACAVAIGVALNINGGNYDPNALALVTAGLLFALVGLFLPKSASTKFDGRKILRILLVLGIVVETICFLERISTNDYVNPFSRYPGSDASRMIAVMCIVLLGALGLIQFFRLTELRQPLMFLMVAIYCSLALIVLHQGMAGIDVVMFQNYAAYGLLHGHNPYTLHLPNIYAADTPFYAPQAIDSSGKWLTFGFPYFPLSALMAVPGFIFGDVRLSGMAAAALIALLMYLSRSGRISAMAAALFMLTPQGMHVLFYGWTEPLLGLTFSLTMICACRWRKMLPWALGLYLATKQYTVLSIPAIWLLCEGEIRWEEFWALIWKAALVAIAITLPFFLWNPHEFLRSVVVWQLIQPFRPDALSYLVWYYDSHGQHIPPIWLPFLPALLAIGLALWRCPRTPAGFASAVTLINLCFFAFNKQAFCNYYYFVIVTACWAVAAADDVKASRHRGFTPILKTETSASPSPHQS